MSSTAIESIQTQALDTMSSGSHIDREARGRALAKKFVNGLGTIVVKFIGDLETEIKEVPQDFVVKPKDELICGVPTFTKYCEARRTAKPTSRLYPRRDRRRSS